jgi:hypothetical protein
MHEGAGGCKQTRKHGMQESAWKRRGQERRKGRRAYACQERDETQAFTFIPSVELS